MFGKYLTVSAAVSVIGAAAFPKFENIQSLISMSDTRMPPINVPADSTLTLNVYKWDTNTMLFTSDDYSMVMRLSTPLNRISQSVYSSPSVLESAYSENDNSHSATLYESGKACKTFEINNPDV